MIVQMLRLSLAAVLAATLWTSAAQAQTWSRAAAFPEASEELYGIAAGGKLHVFGGLAPGWTSKGLVYEYDPATDQWGSLRASMPNPRSASSWGTYKGRIYVAGGEERSDDPWQKTFRAVEAYDPRGNSWIGLPDMTFPRHGMAGDIINGKLHLVSGDAASGGAPGTHIDTDVHEVLEIEGK